MRDVNAMLTVLERERQEQQRQERRRRAHAASRAMSR
jgi:hypothetical protein